MDPPGSGLGENIGCETNGTSKCYPNELSYHLGDQFHDGRCIEELNTRTAVQVWKGVFMEKSSKKGPPPP